MAPCCETPLIRIEKIKKNQIINPGSSPYNQMPPVSPGNNTQTENVLPPQDMTPVVTPSDPAQNNGDITIDFGSPSNTPTLPENPPTFTVPANPLLPPGYQEVLDYNSLQYSNGFYRTQIGRYVRVEQLVGSNTMETREGYLIGVGINYIILQEMSTGNVQVIDIYGIKNMYIYYNYGNSPFPPRTMAEADALMQETESNVEHEE